MQRTRGSVHHHHPGRQGEGLGLAWGSNGGVELLPSGQPGGSCGLQPGKGLQHRRTALQIKRSRKAAAVLWAEEDRKSTRETGRGGKAFTLRRREGAPGLGEGVQESQHRGLRKGDEGNGRTWHLLSLGGWAPPHLLIVDHRLFLLVHIVAVVAVE